LNALVVRNVSKNFAGVQALKNISFSVESGSRWAFLGPNGAGKTTLFHLLSGILKPSGGRIVVFGKDVTGASPQKIATLGVARTFQISSLFPSLTVHENVLLSVLALDEKRFSLLRPISSCNHLLGLVQRILEKWGMESKQYATVRNLSYGEQRQLEIIVALSQNPRLLLLDEPTSGLSPGETSTITSMLRSLPQGITVLLIEHDMDVAFELGEWFVVLHQGMVLTAGSPDEIKTDERVREIYMGAVQ
jgi:branched-chain amino acid transport system ATP-binding protein